MMWGGLLPLSIFEIEVREYKNFTFDAAACATARNIIFAFCFGIFLAALYTAYQRGVVGKPVRALLRAEALSPESAKTLAELGLEKNPFVVFEIGRNATLKTLIKSLVGEGDDAPTRYYIPEELKYRADVRFEAKGNGVAALLITAVVSLALAFALIALFPTLLTIVDNLMG